MKLHGQRGEGRLGLLIALAVCGIGIFLAVKIIPVRIDAYEFKDYMEQECRTAALHKDKSVLGKRIMEKAAALEIPLEVRNLQIKQIAGEMVIRAKYEQPIDLKVTTYTFKFNHEERAPLF
jgi:hypothetical protein